MYIILYNYRTSVLSELEQEFALYVQCTCILDVHMLRVIVCVSIYSIQYLIGRNSRLVFHFAFQVC